jgi:hypothetical protein
VTADGPPYTDYHTWLRSQSHHALGRVNNHEGSTNDHPDRRTAAFLRSWRRPGFSEEKESIRARGCHAVATA